MYSYIDINSGYAFISSAMKYAQNESEISNFIESLPLSDNILITENDTMIPFCIMDDNVFYSNTSNDKKALSIVKDFIERSNGDVKRLLTKATLEDTLSESFKKSSKFIINGDLYKM